MCLDMYLFLCICMPMARVFGLEEDVLLKLRLIYQATEMAFEL